jgi:DNA helicase-2/ATP-dependent DNA helicase PcrA
MFNISEIEVSDSDIKDIEAKFGFTFNQGQVDLLRHWDSIDIQACPGSGKTTTLAAKLMLLINKLPPKFSQGICIITHTNVAVEEIRSKLGDNAKYFFQYPNHFGTIQSFVDKFLAIPYYKNIYKRSPRIVDEYFYDDQICGLYELVANKTIEYLTLRKKIFLGEISFNRHNFEISKSVNDVKRYVINGLKTETSDKYINRISAAKQKLLSEGYLKYDEAYALAFKYIREQPAVLDAISARFPLVFVDEMQDMEEHQSEIISLLFGSGSVIQKIGDINQSIFSSKVSDNDIQWKPVVHPNIKLSHSNRLSDHLANLVKHICCIPQEITGWNNPNPIKPVILVFDHGTILKVKDEFASRVIANNLHTKGLVKIIGSRVSQSKLNIASYWPDFNRNYEKHDYVNLATYLFDLQKRVISARNIKLLRQQFLYAICSALKIGKVKNPVNQFYFSPFSFVKYLRDAGHTEKIQKMDAKIADWILHIKDKQSVLADVTAFLRAILVHFKAQSSVELEAFLTDPVSSLPDTKPEAKIYNYQTNNEVLEIHFDTIHGVKGETHTATLYLETFTRIYDIGGKVLNFLIADNAGRDKQRKDKACYRKLPHAYVAITRATDFLAIAVHKDRFLENHKAYFEDPLSDWEVIHIK